jgi:hypothetical protein
MIEEVKVRRLLALLEKTLGPVEGARPVLRVVCDVKELSPGLKRVGLPASYNPREFRRKYG